MPSRSTATTRKRTTAATAAPKPRKTASARTAAAVTAPAPSHAEIALRAHELYVQSGFQGGREVEFWLEAEKQLKGGMQLR